MTREQQKKFRDLKTALPKIIKEIAAEKKLKKRDERLFTKKSDLFFECLISISVNQNNECICYTDERFKPMWLDELLWELLDMGENKKAPLSLRAVGAFTVYGAPLYEKRTILSAWTEEELRSVVEEYINHFCESINNIDYATFEEKVLEDGYHHDLRAALYYIHNEQYQKALAEIGDQRGCFNNRGLDINDAIRSKCLENIRGV